MHRAVLLTIICFGSLGLVALACDVGSTTCSSGATSLCCNGTDICYLSKTAGACCSEGACCGYLGSSCECKFDPTETCCGDAANTQCPQNTCCCGNQTSTICCAEAQSCCFSNKVPGGIHECCPETSVCSTSLGCVPSGTLVNDLVFPFPCRFFGTYPNPTAGPNALRKLFTYQQDQYFKVVSSNIQDSGYNVQNFDVVVFQFTGAAGLMEFYLSYYTSELSNSTVIDYKLRFIELIEYLESGSKDGYQSGIDTVVQTYALTAEQWGPWAGPLYSDQYVTFNSYTTLGTISISGYVSQNIAKIPRTSVDLTPNMVAFETFFNFTSQYKHPGSRLALRATLKTLTTINVANGGVTLFGDQTAVASIRWNPQANSGSENFAVIVSDLTLLPGVEPEYQVYFSFNTTTHDVIHWDAYAAIENATAATTGTTGAKATTGVVTTGTTGTGTTGAVGTTSGNAGSVSTTGAEPATTGEPSPGSPDIEVAVSAGATLSVYSILIFLALALVL